MATHLIVAEHNGGKLFKGTLNALSAAQKVGGDVHGLVLGKGTQAVADELAKYVGKVHHAEHDGLEHRLAQPWAKVIADCAGSMGATHVWAPATAAGKDIMPRVAARLEHLEEHLVHLLPRGQARANDRRGIQPIRAATAAAAALDAANRAAALAVEVADDEGELV